MIHPLFRLVAAEPEMVADHLGGYAELLGDELRAWGGGWTRRLMLQLAALGLLAVAVALAGVALIVWAATPMAALHAPWVLWVVPLVPLLAAGGCVVAARTGAPGEGFAALRRQLAEDGRLLREAAAS
jgi:uncharacterized membrane protein YqjE